MTIFTPLDTDIVHTLEVDFISRPNAPPIHVTQIDDRLPVIKVLLFKEHQPWALPINAKANIRLGKKDNTYVYNPAIGCNSDRTAVYFRVVPQMVAVPGIVKPIIEIDIDGSKAGSSQISFIIDPDAIQPGEIESSDESKTLNEFVSEAENAARRAESAAADANTKSLSAGTSADQAEASASSAKNDADRAQQLRDSIELNYAYIEDAKNNAQVSARSAADDAQRAEEAAERAESIADGKITASTPTDITGLLKGSGGKVARAVPDTDYLTPEGGTVTGHLEVKEGITVYGGAVINDSPDDPKGIQPYEGVYLQAYYEDTTTPVLESLGSLGDEPTIYRNVHEPVRDTDAANKGYVDKLLAQLCYKSGDSFVDFIKRMAKLASVKGIVTLFLTIVFGVQTLRGLVEVKDFMTIFSMIIAFHFGAKAGNE